MNTIKQGTKLYGTRPEMSIVFTVACSVFARHGYTCTVTSGVGKKHKVGSLHPPGFAHDYRSKHIANTQKKKEILRDLKSALPCCDILLEHIGGEQEHYHVEFDPKDDPLFQSDKKTYKETGKWPN